MKPPAALTSATDSIAHRCQVSHSSPWPKFLAAAPMALAASSYAALPARAADVIAEWPTIQMPPPPTLKPVTVEPKTTALFLFDFMTENCGQRPRCVEAVPTLKALHDRARAANMLVAYTLPGGGKIIDQGIAPRSAPSRFFLQKPKAI
jgi:hypothetical protein